MSKAKPKIVLGNVQYIPYNRLILSQANVRRVKNGVSVDELAEDIAHRGLLQNLNVRPVLNAEGEKTEMYEIPAGGRRYLALGILVKQKRLAKDAGVPCNIKEADDPVTAEEDSLAENSFRSGLHPLDEFRAFQTLFQQGQGHETIAARFQTTPQVVRQRLKLASVSPKLLEVYGANEMTLEQLMAFTLTDDHARQEQVWQGISDGVYSDDPSDIRTYITEEMIATDDRRVVYFGVEKYVAAGGYIHRDLFDPEDGGYLEDATLVDRLFAEQLKADGEKAGAEGWKWVQIGSSFPVGHTNGMRRLHGKPVPLTDEEYAQRNLLRQELDAIDEKYSGAGDCPEEISARYDEIQELLEAFEDRPLAYDPAEMAYAGAFVRVDNAGRLIVERGFVRHEDEPNRTGAERSESVDTDEATESATDRQHRAVITIADVAGNDDDGEDDTAIKPLPDRLITELTSHRTVALQDAVAQNPDVALTLLLHKLCSDLFYRTATTSCLDAAVRTIYMPIQAPGLADTSSVQAQSEREKHFQGQMPEDESQLWDFLAHLPAKQMLALLAFCVSQGVSALFDRSDAYRVQQRIAAADHLARAVGLDMVGVGWQPTVEAYLGRVTKSRILEAVREGAGEQYVQLLEPLKKDAMAKEAERLLENSGWLPEPLRLQEATDEAATEGDDNLPAFLADDPVAA